VQEGPVNSYLFRMEGFMRTGLAFVLLGGVVLTAGGAMLAAPGQDRQDRPGQLTQAKVWVENRGRSEAVPVILQEVITPMPMGVQVIGTPTVTIAPGSSVLARLVRQPWEYRTVNVPPGQDAAIVLSNAGADGWETSGLQFPNPSGNLIVLKRPR
jgi:hypothetical protein